MSARSSTSSTFLIPALFSASSAAQMGDIEAQSPSRSEFEHIRIPSPPAAVIRTSRALEDSAVDDFFGIASPSFIPHDLPDSRPDAASLPVHTDDAPPPPYSHSPEPPAYTRHAEHPTLVKHLFTFGFVFPLLWVAGAFFLISPLRPPQERQSTKSEAEREELVQSMRRAETKWAKRCLLALSVLLLVVVAVVVTAVLVVKT
ncbi:hypothetical protein FOMPIDRAFT_1025054 [Fomitopsis schrenkii]|uniref:Transmembrane protein n=1 Tax=Fomitopsis schrenkii TaxID=2126942 RepID=S8FGB2_FOMSC|nr:hypothetical protein FOMPIDRAFT_1025054 [Fomitopsis schrenkii]